MQNKTAVQQIVERLREKAKESWQRMANAGTVESVSFYKGKMTAFDEAASIAAEFLEQEKKVFIAAYVKGCIDTYGNDEPDENYPDERSGEGYYQQTFKQ